MNGFDLEESVVDRILASGKESGHIHTCANCGSTRGFSSPVAEICESCDAQFQAELAHEAVHA